MLPFPLVHHQGFYLPFGKAHVFPGEKYGLVRRRLLEQHGVCEEDFLTAAPIGLEDVLRVHEPGFVDRLIHGTLSAQEIRRMELPYSKPLVEATLLGCGGTLAAARLSLQHGAAICIGGGFHHAHPDHGEGFCMLHDVAIAIKRLLHDGLIRTALVIDLDVHQGNGTAAIFPPIPAHTASLQTTLGPGLLVGPAAPSEDGVFTLSLHQRNLYPAYKPPSSLDVHLQDGVEDGEYLSALDQALAIALERFRPDLIAYVAGSDPYFDDKLGGLSLTLDGLYERDRLVYETARKGKIPIFTVFAGGYARKLEDTVTIHTNTVLAATRVFAPLSSNTSESNSLLHTDKLTS